MARAGSSESFSDATDTSDQTKSTTEKISYEIGQAGPQQATQFGMEFKDHAANAKDGPDKQNPENSWEIIKALQDENQSLKIENQAKSSEIQSLTGKLESYVHVESSEWRIMRNQSSNSSATRSSNSSVSNISRASKRNFRSKCNGTCLISWIEGDTCAHVIPKHFEAGLRKLFGGKYKIHGEENLLLLQKDVEVAFDSGQICFYLGEELACGENCIKVKILDQSITLKTIGNSKITFKDLEEKFLDMTDHVVSGTLLSHHSKHAIHFAFVMKWIDSPAKANLLALAHFSSPDCVQAQRVSQWLKSSYGTPDGSLISFCIPSRSL